MTSCEDAFRARYGVMLDEGTGKIASSQAFSYVPFAYDVKAANEVFKSIHSLYFFWKRTTTFAA